MGELGTHLVHLGTGLVHLGTDLVQSTSGRSKAICAKLHCQAPPSGLHCFFFLFSLQTTRFFFWRLAHRPPGDHWYSRSVQGTLLWRLELPLFCRVGAPGRGPPGTCAVRGPRRPGRSNRNYFLCDLKPLFLTIFRPSRARAAGFPSVQACLPAWHKSGHW